LHSQAGILTASTYKTDRETISFLWRPLGNEVLDEGIFFDTEDGEIEKVTKLHVL
jgi:hypothetical protein